MCLTVMHINLEKWILSFINENKCKDDPLKCLVYYMDLTFFWMQNIKMIILIRDAWPCENSWRNVCQNPKVMSHYDHANGLSIKCTTKSRFHIAASSMLKKLPQHFYCLGIDILNSEQCILRGFFPPLL